MKSVKNNIRRLSKSLLDMLISGNVIFIFPYLIYLLCIIFIIIFSSSRTYTHSHTLSLSRLATPIFSIPHGVDGYAEEEGGEEARADGEVGEETEAGGVRGGVGE